MKMIRKKAMMVLAALTASTSFAQLPLSVDTSFRTDILWQSVADIHFLSNGQILATGDMKFTDGSHLGWVRLNADGSRDASFPLSGFGAGRMYPWQNFFYVGGGQSYLRKFASGGVDNTFSGYFINELFGSTHAYVYPDGKLLMGGKHRFYSQVDSTLQPEQYCLVKRDLNGAPDTTWQHRVCDFGGHTDFIGPMADGRFYISGSSTHYEGTPVGKLWRIWPDGSLDTTFQTSIFWGQAGYLHQYPDGRLLATGFFQVPEYPGDTLHLLRLLPDGSVDTTYNNQNDFRYLLSSPFPSGNPTSGIVPIEPNVWVCTGQFMRLNGQVTGSLAAFDSLGNVLPQYFTGLDCDSMFLPNLTYGKIETRLLKQSPDGSYFVYGAFTGFDDGYNNYPDQRMIVKLHPLTVGVQEVQPASYGKLAVHPNPGAIDLTVALPLGFERGMLQLQDALGRVVRSERIQRTSANEQHTWHDLTGLSEGVYVLQLNDNHGSFWSAKWVKR